MPCGERSHLSIFTRASARRTAHGGANAKASARLTAVTASHIDILDTWLDIHF